MRKQGVMLAILSKNNPEDVEPVFNHSDMVLQHEDFVAEVINWEPKTVNIRQLAENLNIGLDSFVFLDDNPAERERMRAECPEVEVIDFPKDSSLLPEAIEEAYNNYFLALNVTSEDAKKTAMYRAETQRREAMTTAASVEDYLRKLEMKIDIHIMRPEEEKRVTQLTNKTNQFNVTTKRYTEEQIHKFAISEDSDVVTVHMSDKYGDQGLVSVLILHYSDDEADIDTFLMSCRVMGRNAENEIMYQLRKLLTSKRINKVKAAYIKTAKNAPVLDLFEKMGFTLMNGTVENIGDRKDYEAYPASIIDSPDVFSEVTVGL
jgi:FkbH-like protein